VIVRRPWLVADIGATNARLALAEPDTGTLTNLVQISTANAASLSELLRPYLCELASYQFPSAACVALASPVVGGRCQMTNTPLSFSIEQTRQDLDLEELLVVNDFAATARCLPHLSRAEFHLVGDADIREDAV
jgi:glucokinase